MNERVKDRLTELDIHIIPWVPEWDTLAGRWLIESHRDHEDNEINRAIALDWFRSLRAEPRNTFYAVTSKGAPVGMLGITGQNPVFKSAELHGALDASVRGTGVARLVTTNIIKTLFENGFERLRANPEASNHEAVNLCRRVGFEESDTIVAMELTKKEWLTLKSPLADETTSRG